jgi:hypothetical protein
MRINNNTKEPTKKDRLFHTSTSLIFDGGFHNYFYSIEITKQNNNNKVPIINIDMPNFLDTFFDFLA